MRTHDEFPTIWILSANATQANCYKTQHLGHELTLIKEYEHPQNRQKNLDLVTDRPGRYHVSAVQKVAGHGAFVERHDPKEAEAEHFAHIIAEEINKGRASHSFEKLIVIAPSHFHGLLNKHFDHQVMSRVMHHIEKDYTKYSQKELLSYLGELSR
jgi:protein required for attachment to host cells